MNDGAGPGDSARGGRRGRPLPSAGPSSPAARRLRVGLTGGMAAGKSTVARMLADEGFTVIDADRLVAELYRPGEAGAEAIRALLGTQVLAADGGVDHAQVAARIFARPALRRRVEAAIHPLVRQRFAQIAARTPGVTVLEATLLVEAGQAADFGLLVSVEAAPERRLRRAIDRGMDETEARSRLSAQGDGSARRCAADRVLMNDGTPEQLRQAVAELAEDLRRLAANGDAEHCWRTTMDRSAPTDHPVHALIAQRHSPRVFAERPIAASTLRSLLEAARWAASSYNEQPWAWIVASRQQPEAHARLLDCLVPVNRAWAQGAPVLMLAIARTAFVRNGKRNPHAEYDLGQATAQMVIEATHRGLVAHQMAGFDRAQAEAAFAIPEDCVALAAIAIGYPAAAQTLSAALREREDAPRHRKPLATMVFTERFGTASPLLGNE